MYIEADILIVFFFLILHCLGKIGGWDKLPTHGTLNFPIHGLFLKTT